MAERRTPTTDKVQAMIAAMGAKHTEAGQSTGAKAAIVQVDFPEAFDTVPYVVLTPWSEHIVWLVEKTVNYFKWDNNSKNVDVTVDWFAVNLP